MLRTSVVIDYQNVHMTARDVLASRDTDLVPVLDEFRDLRGAGPNRCARIETVARFNPDARRDGGMSGGSLVPTPPRRIWNTNLGRECYEASIDRRDYRLRRRRYRTR